MVDFFSICVILNFKRKGVIRVKKIIAIVLSVVVVAGIGVGLYFYFSDRDTPKPMDGEKTVTVNVIANGQTETFTAKTQEVYLRGLLEQMELIEGVESDYGLYVQKVNGIAADESLEQWWKFSLNGEMLQTGVETTLFSDGDVVDIELIQGYDSF